MHVRQLSLCRLTAMNVGAWLCFFFCFAGNNNVVVAVSSSSASSEDSSCPSSSETTSCPSSSLLCGTAQDLQYRVAHAIDTTTTVSSNNNADNDDDWLTEMGKSLRVVTDEVLTPDECRWIQRVLPPVLFVQGDGYSSSSSSTGDKAPPPLYGAPTAYAGLGLQRLAKISAMLYDTTTATGKGDDDDERHDTTTMYERILEFRERVRQHTERALGLCPGTLHVHFTHISQRSVGGQFCCAWDPNHAVSIGV